MECFPAKEDEIFADSFREQMDTWFGNGKNRENCEGTEQAETWKYAVMEPALALELDHPSVYTQFLKQSIDEFLADYQERYPVFQVDAMCAKMLDPEFNKGIEVVVLPNLYGDIVTDVAAEHQGGLGTASSSNLGNKYAMFEAIHGTAPFLINHGRGDYADPCSLIRAAGMLMAHIGYADRKAVLDKALDICTITERKKVVTTDVDGASAAEFTDYLLETIDKIK